MEKKIWMSNTTYSTFKIATKPERAKSDTVQPYNIVQNVMDSGIDLKSNFEILWLQ